MSKKRDYTSYSFVLTIIVVALLLVINFIPSFKIGNITFKRTNIITDIMSQRDSAALIGSDIYFDTTFLAESIKTTANTSKSGRDTIPTAKTESWELGTTTPSSCKIVIQEVHNDIPQKISTSLSDQTPTEIKDFGSDGKHNYLANLLTSLSKLDKKRPARIAILGDSFIEGDILSADIREQLQSIYGGGGVGFVPFSLSLPISRGTIKHTFKGWDTYNVIKKRSTPEEFKDKFFISGMTCIPQEGAKTRLQGVSFRKYIKKYSVAKLIFINRGNSTIHVMVNDSTKRTFTPEPSEYVQQINVTAEINTLDITIENVEGFIGYGIILEEKSGVSVDSYSIRGNSGMALFATNASINNQINKLLGYDLIILQYGLNAMSATVNNYDSYSAQLVKVINYIKKCFPTSAILVMGVGDRSTQNNGNFVTMPAVHAMIAAQISAAEKTKVAFWNTFDAMGGENSMTSFVKRNWAAKDYTHIGYAGGKYIGREFVKSLVKEVKLNEKQTTQPKVKEIEIAKFTPTIPCNIK